MCIRDSPDHQRIACIGGNQGNDPGPRTPNRGDTDGDRRNDRGTGAIGKRPMSPRADRRARIATARLLRGDRDGSDNGGMPPDLDARVKALEARTSEIGVDVRAVIKDVAEIKGKISQMPTAFQMQAW